MFLVFPYDMLNVGLMESNTLAQLWQVYVKRLSTEQGIKKVLNKCSFHFFSDIISVAMLFFLLKLHPTLSFSLQVALHYGVERFFPGGCMCEDRREKHPRST